MMWPHRRKTVISGRGLQPDVISASSDRPLTCHLSEIKTMEIAQTDPLSSSWLDLRLVESNETQEERRGEERAKA